MNVPFGQPALITMHHDVPGVVAVITGELYRRGLNLARMDLKRSVRGGLAVAVFVLDGAVAPDLPERIRQVMPACERAILLSGETEEETR
ncbi:MAG: ACT domain-containing protein, partial [Pyramidobacter sp.]|nr:ACT domain-containing protein [Pyramidobacter sp.]